MHRKLSIILLHSTAREVFQEGDLGRGFNKLSTSLQRVSSPPPTGGRGRRKGGFGFTFFQFLKKGKLVGTDGGGKFSEMDTDIPGMGGWVGSGAGGGGGRREATIGAKK